MTDTSLDSLTGASGMLNTLSKLTVDFSNTLVSKNTFNTLMDRI